MNDFRSDGNWGAGTPGDVRLRDAMSGDVRLRDVTPMGARSVVAKPTVEWLGGTHWDARSAESSFDSLKELG